MTGNAALSASRSADLGSWDAVEDPNLRALAAEPLTIRGGNDPTVPFIFASPHSGRFYPSSFAQSSRLDPISLRRSEDAFVDELFDGVTDLGAPLIAARFPRAFVDANRAPGELDPAMFDAPLVSVGPRSPRVAAGLGVIPRVVRDGLEIYRARLPAGEAAFRLEHFYRPYHAALADLVEQARAEFGARLLHESGERRVEGAIEVLEPEHGFAGRQPRAVNLETVADHARDHAKPRGHARRARSDRIQGRIEHRGIELAGCAVR